MPPKIVRVMRTDGDQPAVGDGSAMLGARLIDLGLDADSSDSSPVGPGSGGVSVAGCVRTLLGSLLPKRFGQQDPDRFRGARASNSQCVWTMGDGPYEPSPVSEDLDLRITLESDPPGHGSVEPNRVMPFREYQQALAATRPQWRIEERHSDDCAVCKRFGLE